MKLASLLVIAGLLTGPLVVGTSAQSAKIIALESPDAPGHVTQKRLEECFRLLQNEAGVADRSLPPIVVLHISRKQATQAGLRQASIVLRRNSGINPTDSCYELWLIGDPSTAEYSTAMNRIIEDELQLHRTTEQQAEAIARTVRWLDATVSASVR